MIGTASCCPHFFSFLMGRRETTPPQFLCWAGAALCCPISFHFKWGRHDTYMPPLFLFVYPSHFGGDFLPFASTSRGGVKPFPVVSTNGVVWNQHATSVSLHLPPWSRGVFSACSIDKWGATWNWHPPISCRLPSNGGCMFFLYIS